MTTTSIEQNPELAEVAADIARAKSVVGVAYKKRYLQRVLEGAKGAKGVSKKAQARSCGDWLALQIAKLCLREKDKIDLDAFVALLDANGVDHSRWTNRNKGWEGRFRMTGRLALQRVVAEADGELELPSGETVVAPKSWVAAHTH